jgi:hypothetical protein
MHVVMQYPADWCKMHMDCWEAIVDSWRTPEAYVKRREKSGHAKGRTGPAHHQGSHPLGSYMDTWVPFTLIYLFIYLFILIMCNHPCVFLTDLIAWWSGDQ